MTRFNKSVRVAQGIIRRFLAIKRAQKEAIGRLWIQLESAYLRKTLKFRRDKQSNPRLRSLTADLNLLDRHSRETMSKQARKWANMDAKVEAVVNRLKAKKILHSRTEEEDIRRHLLPEAIRKYQIDRLIVQARREFYKTTPSLSLSSWDGQHHHHNKPHGKNKNAFTERDALDMLAGRNMESIYARISNTEEEPEGALALAAAIAKVQQATDPRAKAKAQSLVLKLQVKLRNQQSSSNNNNSSSNSNNRAMRSFKLFSIFAQPERREAITNIIKDLHIKLRDTEIYFS